MTTQQQQFKLIFKGRLEFNNKRSFEMAIRHWENRLETYYKTDVLFKIEDIFVEDENALILPQQVIMSTEKFWRNTTGILSEIAQFGIVGTIGAWLVDNGNLLEEQTIEPNSEKTAVASYIHGRELVQKGENYSEASAALSQAISKYERHALAYERRGYINYKLKNYNDALHDFDKSVGINPNNAEPYYGRGKVRMIKNEWDAAAQDFENTYKRSIALQPIYWLARLRRGESLFHSKRFEEAIKEFQLFLRRPFREGDPNFQRRRRALMLLGRAYVELDKLDDGLEAIDQAMAIKAGKELAPDTEGLVTRAIAKRKAGTEAFTQDLEKAAEMGSPEATRLLAEWQ